MTLWSCDAGREEDTSFALRLRGKERTGAAYADMSIDEDEELAMLAMVGDEDDVEWSI